MAEAMLPPARRAVQVALAALTLAWAALGAYGLMQLLGKPAASVQDSYEYDLIITTGIR